MFVKYSFIPDIHKSSLETVIRNHGFVTETYLAKLYELVLALINGKAPGNGEYLFAKMIDAENVIASVTDARNGVYLQLAGSLKSDDKQLTVGRKWATQITNAAAGTTGVKQWANVL